MRWCRCDVRTTRATAAVARLNQRCPQAQHSMSLTGSGMLILNLETSSGKQRVGVALPLDEFVQFVNAQGPQLVRRQTKSDIAFEKQLVKKDAK